MSPETHTQTAHNCDAIEDLIPDYAFGLTDAETARLVESNLPHCPEAAAQLADFRRIQESLREDVPQIEPPQGLEARLLAKISAPEVSAAVQPPKRHWAWWAAAAVIALVLTNLYWLVRLNALEQRHEELFAQIAGNNGSAFILTDTTDLRWVRLPASENVTRPATAILMWNADSKNGLLYTVGFPELAAGKTYQLWLTRGENLVSAGTFRVDERGSSAMLFNIAEAIDDYTWARITEEPENGSAEPTGTVVAVGEL
jgi:anti-sigma-K factor RskA